MRRPALNPLGGLTWMCILALTTNLPVLANPFSRYGIHDSSFRVLRPRDCATYCGANNQYCCGAHEICSTRYGNNAATCVAAAAYAQFTTTWTETRTYTSTIMTNWIPPPQPTAGVDCVPQGSEQQACGPICCAGWQTCAFSGQCSIKPGFVEPSTVVITSDGKLTTRYSAPFRVTGVTTITNNGLGAGVPTAATTTGAAGPASTGDGAAGGGDASTNGNGLSAGAIAGIVIGSLAGISLLLLLCFCCLARGLWNAIFGRKKKRRQRKVVEIQEEGFVRRSSRLPSAAHSRRSRHSGWFGGNAPPSAADYREKKKAERKWWLGVAGVAGTLLALLNLKKDKPKTSHRARTAQYSDSLYTYSDATDPYEHQRRHRDPLEHMRRQKAHRSSRLDTDQDSGTFSSERVSMRIRDDLPPPSHYSRSSRRP